MINPKIVETKTRIFSRHFSGRGTSNIKYYILENYTGDQCDYNDFRLNLNISEGL